MLSLLLHIRVVGSSNLGTGYIIRSIPLHTLSSSSQTAIVIWNRWLQLIARFSQFLIHNYEEGFCKALTIMFRITPRNGSILPTNFLQSGCTQHLFVTFCVYYYNIPSHFKRWAYLKMFKIVWQIWGSKILEVGKLLNFLLITRKLVIHTDKYFFFSETHQAFTNTARDIMGATRNCIYIHMYPYF